MNENYIVYCFILFVLKYLFYFRPIFVTLIWKFALLVEQATLTLKCGIVFKSSQNFDENLSQNTKLKIEFLTFDLVLTKHQIFLKGTHYMTNIRRLLYRIQTGSLPQGLREAYTISIICYSSLHMHNFIVMLIQNKNV